MDEGRIYSYQWPEHHKLLTHTSTNKKTFKHNIIYTQNVAKWHKVLIYDNLYFIPWNTLISLSQRFNVTRYTPIKIIPVGGYDL